MDEGPTGATRSTGVTELPELSRRVATVLALDPAAGALEFDGVWHPWAELEAAADAVGRAVVPGERVAVLLRNRPAHVGLLLGVLRAGACLVTVNPERGRERVRADLASLGVATVAGDRADLTALAPAVRWLVSDRLGQVEVVAPRVAADAGPSAPGVAVEMLTSGTTGAPKRVPLTYETLVRVLDGTKHYERNRDDELRLRRGVIIVNSPMVHLGGLFRILQCVNDGRAFCLLERFGVEPWADAVRRHRPRTVSLVPAALRMVLEAGLDPDDLSSVRSVVSGTAPLSADDADAFFEQYGVPVLIAYAATEFGGGVAGWNLTDHERFWSAKRGSVGRAHAGCELRVVDPGTGEPLGPDQEGLLEVKARQMGDAPDWIRTTDLARLDADGFLWIVGRADQAVIRGGFKVRPEDVRLAIESHPGVRGAAVIGVADARLGAVPVAAVERRSDLGDRSDDELLDDLAEYLAERLAPYELPTRIEVVEVLPRTDSGKVDLTAVRAILDTAPAED
jgi:acyl-CoA synthetase (AMP-forming)/AMP-acid ligase II